MSMDRVVTFQRMPTLRESAAAIRRFLSGTVRRISMGPQQEFFYLYGEQRRCYPHSPPVEGERCIEVVYLPDDSQIVVTTRLADDFTRALADGLAKMLAAGWEGVVDWPG